MNAICPYCWLTIISKLVSHHQSYATFISNFLVVIINVDSNHHWWYWYIPGRNFRSNCRNYRRALLLFEMDVANPPSPVQIEAICFSRSKAKNWFYLNEPLENMQKHRVFWVLLINYDNFSGNWQELCTYNMYQNVQKNLRFQLVLNFWLNVWPQMSMIPL